MIGEKDGKRTILMREKPYFYKNFKEYKDGTQWDRTTKTPDAEIMLSFDKTQNVPFQFNPIEMFSYKLPDRNAPAYMSRGTEGGFAFNWLKSNETYNSVVESVSAFAKA